VYETTYEDIDRVMKEARLDLIETWDRTFEGQLSKFITVNKNPELATYQGAKVLEVDVQTQVGYATTATKLGRNRAPAYDYLRFKSNRLFHVVEMGHEEAEKSSHSATNTPGVPNVLLKNLADAKRVIPNFMDRVFYGDGSETLAIVADVAIESTTFVKNGTTLNVSKVYLDPPFTSIDRYPQDATSLIEVGQPADFASIDISSADAVNMPYGAVEVVDNATDGFGYEILDFNDGGGTAHAAYAIVYPRVGGDVAPGMALISQKSQDADGYNTGAGVGIAGIVGNGHVNALGSALMPRKIGNRYYGQKDSQADGLGWLNAPVYNLIPELHGSTETALVDLTSEDGLVLTKFYDYCQNHLGDAFSPECLLMHRDTKLAYMKAAVGRDFFSLFQPAGPVTDKNGVDLGFTAPFWTAPDGRKIPIFTTRRMFRGTIVFPSLSSLMPAIEYEGWKTGPEYGYFEDMILARRENVLATVYRRYYLMAALQRALWASIWNVKTKSTMT